MCDCADRPLNPVRSYLLGKLHQVRLERYRLVRERAREQDGGWTAAYLEQQIGSRLVEGERLTRLLDAVDHAIKAAGR